MRVAAVVLSWNRRDNTIACLESLSGARGTDDVLICVDNGSTDGTVEAVRERFPHVRLIPLGTNTGFAHGNNAGIRVALEGGADWVLLVNNDVTVRDDVFAAIRATAARWPAAGVLAGKLFLADPPDRLWFAGQRVRLRLGYSGRPYGYGRHDGRRYRRERPVDRAAGALMAVSRPALERVGLLDDELFAYGEDVDLCLRARSAGFDTVLAPEAVGWHLVSASSGGEALSTHTVYYGTRNLIVVNERHLPLAQPATTVRRLCVAGSMAIYTLGRPNRRDGLAAAWNGYRDARRGRLGQRPEAHAAGYGQTYTRSNV